MGCGSSAMFKEKKVLKEQSFVDYNEEDYCCLQDALKPSQGGSVIDLTIKTPKRSKSKAKQNARENVASVSTDSAISSQRSTGSMFEEYDELPPLRRDDATRSGNTDDFIFEDYDVPSSRSMHKVDLTSPDYDVPRSGYLMSHGGGSSTSSHDEYDYPRSCQYHADPTYDVPRRYQPSV